MLQMTTAKYIRYITKKVASDFKCSFVHKPNLHLFVFCLRDWCLLYLHYYQPLPQSKIYFVLLIKNSGGNLVT